MKQLKSNFSLFSNKARMPKLFSTWTFLRVTHHFDNSKKILIFLANLGSVERHFPFVSWITIFLLPCFCTLWEDLCSAMGHTLEGILNNQ